MVSMTEDEIQDAVCDNAGFCTACKAITSPGGVEGDAENYPCPKCHKRTVMGIEVALILGHIQ